METISLTLTEKEIKRLYTVYKDSVVPSKNEYIDFVLKVENCTINVYKSKRVVFQGKDAVIYASSFGYLCEKPETKTETNKYPQAGSDEVGTGDYFGPICVCACIVRKEDLDIINSLKVQDSKAITDVNIRKIAPKLMKQLKYSLLIVDNKKYNEIHDSHNINAVKALLHNQAYVNLKKKYHQLPSFMIIDQFTPEKNYYGYIKTEKEIVKDIHFETKAENKFPSVACASIIARYAFLDQWDKMEKEYHMTFTKGASSLVDEDAKKFVDQYGFDALNNIAKIHFKNTEKIK